MPRLIATIGILAIGLASTAGECLGQSPRALWQKRVVNSPAAAPTMSGDTVWVAGLDRRIVAHDLNTGRRFWRRNLPTAAALPAVPAGPHLFVAIGGPEPGIVALDRTNGRERWSRPVRGRPVAVERWRDQVLVVTLVGQLNAFDAQDGAERYRRDLPGRIAWSGMVGDSLCVAARRDSIWTIAPGTGVMRGAAVDSGGPIVGGAWTESGLLLLDHAGRLSRVDRSTGATRAEVRCAAPQIRSPGISGGIVMVAATGGELEAYRLPGLEALWSMRAGETFAVGSVPWGESWVLAAQSGRVLGLTRDRGSQAWTLEFRSPISVEPVCDPERICLIDERGRMVVYVLEGGR